MDRWMDVCSITIKTKTKKKKIKVTKWRKYKEQPPNERTNQPTILKYLYKL